MSLTQDDQTMLETIGLTIYHTSVSIFIEAICWGCYALLFAFSVYIQISNGLKSIRNKILLFVTCLLFLVSTALLSLNFTWLLRNKIKMLLMVPDASISLEDRYDASTAEIPRFGTPSEAMFMLNMLVGDCVVVWRAFAIWERRVAIIFVPVICLLAALGFAITDVICLHASENPATSTIPVGSRVCVWAEPITWGLSLFTNILSTSLIAVKAWRLRQSFKEVMGPHSRKTWAQRVLILLIGEIILFFDIDSNSDIRYLWDFFAAIGDQISGIYPTAIIVLVSLQHSFVETTVITAQTPTDVPMSHIEFANVLQTDQTASTHRRSFVSPTATGVEGRKLKERTQDVSVIVS
ncbi:hypothetical protein D9758_007088 [Tetrapyrgos nigripes]|uniref:Uncharacterized protein n=1 Tax=Tetrapyrgos nigripes TaxID=182062 RepID=A0A8H5LMQ6_9AGAR|nr:hypothetical protein D9758_007088 [Tetrapyrgos nigripes]